MAHEIIAGTTNTTYDGPVVIRHYHYYNDPFWYPTIWYPRGPSVIVLPSDNCRPAPVNTQSDRRKKDDDTAKLIGVAAAVIGGVTLYFLGSAISKIQDANVELEDTKNYQQQMARYRNAGTDSEQENTYKVLQVADLKERICTRVADSAWWDVALRTGLAASCGIALAGSFAVVPAATMWYGVYGATGAVAGMLFKAGLDSSDKMNFRDAQAMQSVLQEIRA